MARIIDMSSKLMKIHVKIFVYPYFSEIEEKTYKSFRGFVYICSNQSIQNLPSSRVATSLMTWRKISDEHHGGLRENTENAKRRSYRKLTDLVDIRKFRDYG